MDKINSLINYYKNNGLLIIGLNDSQGVNTTSTFLKKGLLEFLKDSLTSDELTPEVINAFSLTMNKTEHIDYFLQNNLTVEEIKLSQIYSAVSALEKVMKDMKLPKVFGQIGNVYKTVYSLNDGDENIRITDSIKTAYEPVIIYSSGVNDLMREVGSNPFALKKDYKNKNIKPNYDYTLEKVNNPNTLNKVINSIKRNYENIYSINGNSDIYTLGSYIPKSLEKFELDIFRKLVIEYNERLQELCKIYGITFIDTEEVGKKYNTSEANFHITGEGHNVIANTILNSMYQNKFNRKEKDRLVINHSFEITNRGSKGVIENTYNDYQESFYKSMELDGYSRERELQIMEEHKRETEIFQKVLVNKAKK